MRGLETSIVLSKGRDVDGLIGSAVKAAGKLLQWVFTSQMFGDVIPRRLSGARRGRTRVN